MFLNATSNARVDWTKSTRLLLLSSSSSLSLSSSSSSPSPSTTTTNNKMNREHVPRATDLHRVYIQSLLSRRAMTEDVALEMYKRAIGAVLSTLTDMGGSGRVHVLTLATIISLVVLIFTAVTVTSSVPLPLPLLPPPTTGCPFHPQRSTETSCQHTPAPQRACTSSSRRCPVCSRALA